MISKLLGYLVLIVILVLIISNPTGAGNWLHHAVSGLVTFAQSAAK